MPDRVPQLVDLPAPRQLKDHERALLEFVLKGPFVSDEVRAQAANVEVVGECDCGCRSVAIQTAPNSTPAPIVHPGYPRTDWVPLTAWGRSSEGTEIEITLHVVSGRLIELEIWDAWDSDRESKGELPELATLRHDSFD